MTSLPQKPLITRPPGVPLSEASCFLPQRRRGGSGTKGKGLLGSIGFHLAVALIAGAFVLTGKGTTDEGSQGLSEGSPSFEMRVSPEKLPEIPQPPKVKPTPVFPTSVRRPIMAFPELVSNVVIPPSEPIPPVTATESAPPSAVPESTEASGGKSVPTSGQSVGRSLTKGSGHGQTAKHKQPTAPPKLLQAPPPRYPAKAKSAKITGMTAVLIRVCGNGSAGCTSLYHSSGNSELDQAAITAARGWKFTPLPALQNGETIPVVVHVTFSL